MVEKYLNPTQAAGRDLILRNIQGPVVMLNLLRFRKIADYSETPGISPLLPISGEEAYQLYIGQALPHLLKSGGEILFLGKGGSFLIGPVDEQWDEVMLIKQNSVSSFMSFASNAGYINSLGHRTAALENSRLLPLVEYSYLIQK